MTLGKYTSGADCYTKRAGKNSSYFDMGRSDWNKVKQRYNLNNNQMFEIFNKPALDDAVAQRKQIRFSHDPRLGEYKKSSLRKEWDYLQEIHGYETLTPKGGYWYAN